MDYYEHNYTFFSFNLVNVDWGILHSRIRERGRRPPFVDGTSHATTGRSMALRISAMEIRKMLSPLPFRPLGAGSLARHRFGAVVLAPEPALSLAFQDPADPVGRFALFLGSCEDHPAFGEEPGEILIM